MSDSAPTPRRRWFAVLSAALLVLVASASLVPAGGSRRAALAGVLAVLVVTWSVAVLRRPSGPPRWASGALLLVVVVFPSWWRSSGGFFLAGRGILAFAAALPLATAIVAVHAQPGAVRRVLRSLVDPVVLALLGWPALFGMLAVFDASSSGLGPLRTWVVSTVALVVFVAAADVAPRIEVAARPRWSEPGRARGILLAAYAAIAALTVIAIRRQWPLNQDPDVTDQGAVLANALALLDSPAVPIGDRNRMPLLAYLTSLRLDPATTVEGALETGKWVAVAVALAATAVLAWWAARRLSALAAAVGVAVVALTLVAFKAPWVEADLLSFLLILAAMIGAWRLLVVPSAMRGAWLGIILGVAQLTKASALPLLLAVVGGAALGLLLPRRWTGVSSAARRGMVPATASMLLLFALVLAPNGVNTAREYGSPLYNDNSSAFFWADSWEDAYRSVVARYDGTGLRPHEAGEEPSFERYRREHDLGDAVDRLRAGARHQRSLARGSYGYGRFWVLLLCGAAVAIVCGDRSLLRRRRLPLVVLVGAVVGYQLLSWWWDPIAQGERFLLVMFLPTVLGSLALIDRSAAEAWVVLGDRRLHLATALEGTALALLLWRLPALLELAGTVSGGR